jgi:kynurenine 3-monooxygenase
MSHTSAPDFTIVGAGLGGALLALYLGQAGYSVELFERRPDPRPVGGYGGGRSINLALSTRGLFALREVGLADEVLKIAVPMRGRMIHDPQGHLTFQPYDKAPNRAINSVSRSDLNLLMIQAAGRLPNVTMHFDMRCADVDLDAPRAYFRNDATGEERVSSGQRLIGFDGAGSAVRGRMQREPGFNYRQDFLQHGYKELHIPPAEGGGFRIEKNALHIWPRKRYMMIALPNPDGSFTVTCFWPLHGENSFENLRTEEEVMAYFRAHFPDAVPHMPDLAHDYMHNPVGTLATIRCAPWHHEGKVLLLGDAAHAIVPFYGQGMNCAFEDCTVFMRLAKQFGPDWSLVFERCFDTRKQNADTLADLALHNFIEMRDHTGSRWFQVRKKIERTLHRWLPGWYTPLYTMVSFTTVPYAEAVDRARRQDRTVIAAAALIGLGLLVIGYMLLRTLLS